METVSLCTLRVGDEVFGFETQEVREVLGVRAVTKVPLAPKFVAGVVAYRGEVLMVVCLRKLLGLEPSGKPPSLLVLQDEHEGELFGLAVDSVDDVVRVSADDLEGNPATLDERRKALCAGAYKVGEGWVVLLKPELLWPMRLIEPFGQ